MTAKKRNSGKGCLVPILIVGVVASAFGRILDEFASNPSTVVVIMILAAALFAAVYGGKRYLAWEQEQFDRAEAEKKAAEAAALAKQKELAAARRKQQIEEEEAEKQRQIEAQKFERQQQLDALRESIPLAPLRVSDVPAERGTVVDHVFSSITTRTRIASISNYVVVDVETTGLHPRSSEIVEVAAIRFEDFEPVERFESLCFPLNGIDSRAAEINGISEDMVVGKPTFQQIAASLQDFIGESNVVGHNLAFDLKFLESYGVDFGAGKRKYFDTLTLARLAWPRALNYKLQTLCHGLEIENVAGHRSFGDALATGQLFEKIAHKRIGDDG